MVEDDHVVPRGLWPARERSNVDFVRVPACRACNVLKSKGENDLIAYSVIDKDGGTHPYASELAPKIGRSIKRGRANVANAVLSSQMTPLITKNGVYLGDYPSATINNTNMMQTLRMVVRGLYYTDTRTILPPHEDVEVWVIPSHNMPAVFGPMGELPHPEPRVLGERVFWWVPYIPLDEPTTSAWPMSVYDRVFFVGATGNPVRAWRARSLPSRDLVTGKRWIAQVLGPRLIDLPGPPRTELIVTPKKFKSRPGR
jgi:hypothetical protein